MTPTTSLSKSINNLALLGFISLLAACTSTQQSARFCDTSGCSEKPLSNVSADYLQQPVAGKSKQILQLEHLAQSNPKAAYDLALRYFRGEGVTRDSYQALQWMRKAGDAGLLEAQKALGGFYLSGLEEMGSDPQEAEKWFSMAAAQGDQESAALMNEASSKKTTEAQEYRWRQHWQQYYRNHWYHSYPYLGRWSHSYWYY